MTVLVDFPILGIHHVTAIARYPQPNLDFYTQVLGLRLVKRTVNFDDPGTYHLYYGDELGRPGTILTFFPWTWIAGGRAGSGQLTVTAFAVPGDALDYWEERLGARGVETERVTSPFGEPGIAGADPDGLRLELLAAQGGPGEPWADGPVPVERAIAGFGSVVLSERDAEPTIAFLSEVLGFRRAAEGGGRIRLETGEGGPGARVEVAHEPDAKPGRLGGGTVHHVAWRVAGEAEQRAWRAHLVEAGVEVTPVMDRHYFRSIYFREPGGVLFEIATDPPGFTADEAPEALGRALKLPEWLEESRGRIERALPPLEVPAG